MIAPMKSPIGLVAAVLILFSTGAIALLWHDRDATAVQLEQAQTASKKLADELQSLKKERDTLRNQTVLLERRVQNAETESRKASTALAESAKAAASTSPGATSSVRRADFPKPGANAPGSMKALAEMMKNPAMREMVKQQQIAQIDMHYGGLISRFGLNDTEKANFKQLLADRMGIETDMSLKMMDESLTQPQRDALVKEMSDAKKVADEKIKTFLNNDQDYDAWQKWEATKAERTQLEMGRSLFAEEPLSTEQEEQLVAAMQRASKMPSAYPDLTKPGTNAAQITPQMVEQQMTRYDQQAQAAYNEAARFMSPKQLAALQAMQKQWRDMTEAGMKMSMMMFGKEKK